MICQEYLITFSSSNDGAFGMDIVGSLANQIRFCPLLHSSLTHSSELL